MQVAGGYSGYSPSSHEANSGFGANPQVKPLELALGEGTADKQPQVYSTVALWGCPKIRGTLLGVPMIRIIVLWDLYWGPLILGSYHKLGH